jgi:hypothetical protein
MRKTFAFITEENDKWGSKAFLVWNSFHFDKVSENAKNASRTVVTKDNQIEFKTKKLYCFGQKIGTESFSFHQMPSFIFFIQRSFLFERLVFFSFIIMEP